jgi:hypothetical protein
LFGLGTIDQVAPFQDSTSVSKGPWAVLELPTAVHDDTDTQDTLSNKAMIPGGFGFATIDQTEPFQDSISDCSIPGLVPPPTAVHADAETQDTPPKTSPAPATLGLGTTDHAVPSHDSTSVPAGESPTAAQNEVDTQETLVNPLPSARLGVGTMDHDLPFHDSANVWDSFPPTAIQNPADTQDTPFSRLKGAAVLGLGTIDHELPFQSSTNVESGG